MSSRITTTRRQFLVLAGATTAGAMLAACGATPTATPVPATATKAPAAPTAAPVPPTATKAAAAPTAAPVPPTATKAAAAAPTAAPATAGAFKEAPMLAALVKAGKLPPVEQRLPKDPQVIKPFEQVGAYGGTINFAVIETNMWIYCCFRTTGLLRYNQSNTEISVDIAKSYKFSADGKTFTIELREGHKWSDGTPFTVDDIIYWWEDVANNKELTPSPAVFWQPGGKPAVFKKVSPTVLDITFAVPYPVVTDRLGRSWFSSDYQIFGPKHYLQKYHIKYNPQANDVAKTEKFDGWVKAHAAHWFPADYFEVARPHLWMWIPETVNTERAVAVRNPYFYQVDPEGNQLPYIDRTDAQRLSQKDVVVLKASSGELDFEAFYMSLKDMAVLKQNQEKGKFRVLLPETLRTSQCALMPNRTVKDPVLKDLFNKKDFRIALSLAINRKAMNEALFYGLGKEMAAVCHPKFSFFKPEWATQYAQYDVAKANALLDGLGLTKKDADGYRLRSDGAGRINLLLEIGSAEGPKQEMCEMMAKDFQKVGLEATVKYYEGTLFNQRHLSNDLQIPTWHLDRAGLFGRADPLFFGWDNISQQRWGGQWALWFTTDGKEGIEPPADIKALKELHNKWEQTVVGSADFNKLGAEYYGYFANEIPMIGNVGLDPIPLVVSNRLRNVQEKDINWSSDTNFYAPYLPAQWYIKA